MAGNTHRANCANAQHPGCRCSGCGGSLHGWQGWTSLAFDTQQARDDRRQRLAGKVERDRRGDLKPTAPNRRAFIDLARLDIAEHMSATAPDVTLGDRSLPEIRIGDATAVASDAGRVTALGHALLEEPGEEISSDVGRIAGNERDAQAIKKQLADHTWCGLLVALIQGIEKVDTVVKLLSDEGQRFVKNLLLQDSSGSVAAMADAVVDVVVDRVWSALGRIVEAHVPLFGEDTLRVLRILALFACPSVEHHPEVYKHAARPLMGDARNLVSDEVTAQVGTLFTAWWTRRGPEAMW